MAEHRHWRSSNNDAGDPTTPDINQPGPYGDAQLLSKAKNTAVEGLVAAGILESRAGKVRLIPRDGLPVDWSPEKDSRLVVWEVLQHLVRRLEVDGEVAAAGLLVQARGLADTARELAYRLYFICERKGWTGEALAYNGLVVAWPELLKLARRSVDPEQNSLDI